MGEEVGRAQCVFNGVGFGGVLKDSQEMLDVQRVSWIIFWGIFPLVLIHNVGGGFDGVLDEASIFGGGRWLLCKVWSFVCPKRVIF